MTRPCLPLLLLLAACGAEGEPTPTGALDSHFPVLDSEPYSQQPDLGAPDAGPSAQPDAKPAGPACQGLEVPFNGHCYLAIGYKWMDYDAASKLCAANQSQVASILSAAENKFVFTLLDPLNQAAWLGLRRTNNKFSWVDSHPLSYANWAPGEPNNEEGSEHCAVMWGPHLSKTTWHGKWNDVPCDDPGRDTVICKRKP